MSFPKTAEVLFEEAKKMGLKPTWLTDYGLFSITVDEKTGYVFYARNMMNSNLSSFLAIDKHATRTVLQQHGLPNIPFGMFDNKEDVKRFLDENKIIIAKPVLGSSSKDVHLITADTDISSLELTRYIFEKFIKGREMRYLVFHGAVIAVHEKIYPGPINDPKKVKRISFQKEQWDKKLCNLSLQIAKILYLHFAAVDYLIDEESRAYVLEVNSSPGLNFFEHPTSGPSLHIARMFLEEMVKEIKKDSR